MREKWLCDLWRRQRWASSTLAVADGRSLNVVYSGRHTFDHGPDFRDALLVFGNDLVRGDVEVHVKAGDWRLHGHHTDEEYNRVALHVVWHDDGLPAHTAAGRFLPVLALEAWTLESTSYPNGHRDDGAVGVESDDVRPWCPGHVRSAQVRMALLAKLGMERLVGKASIFEAALSAADREQVYYAALLDSLGYTGNRQPFGWLANAAPWHVVSAVCTGASLKSRAGILESLFFGAAGLLPSQRRLKRTLPVSDQEYVTQLEDKWSELNILWQIAPLGQGSWRFSRVRPENHPTRRLSAAARMLAPFTESGLADVLTGLVMSEEAVDIPRALEHVLTVPAQGYWATHHDFGGREDRPTQLCGRARVADIAVNVVLPLAMSIGQSTGDSRLVEQSKLALKFFPAISENELTRYASRLIFGPSRPRGTTCLHQQGLLHVYHRFCKEKRCGDCPITHDEDDLN